MNLAVINNERRAFPDAYSSACKPAEKPLMTVILTFEEAVGVTRYRARVHHWSLIDHQTHEDRGFHGAEPKPRIGSQNSSRNANEALRE